MRCRCQPRSESIIASALIPVDCTSMNNYQWNNLKPSVCAGSTLHPIQESQFEWHGEVIHGRYPTYQSDMSDAFPLYPLSGKA